MGKRKQKLLVEFLIFFYSWNNPIFWGGLCQEIKRIFFSAKREIAAQFSTLRFIFPENLHKREVKLGAATVFGQLFSLALFLVAIFFFFEEKD